MGASDNTHSNGHKPNVWEMSGDDVLSVIFMDSAAWRVAYIRYGLRPIHFSTPKQKALYSTLVELRKADTALSDTAILDHCGSVVSLHDIGILANLYDDLRSRTFEDSVSRVREHGLTSLLKAHLAHAQKRLADGERRKAVSGELLTTLTTLESAVEIPRVTAAEVSTDLDAIFNATPEPPLWTGVSWLDDTIGGVGTSKLWGMVAPYKSRKTYTALNVLVGMVMAAHLNKRRIPSLAFMSAEMTTEELGMNVVAMLAVARLHAQGFAQLKDDRDIPLTYITGENLLRFGSSYRKWHTRKVEAVDWARRIFREVFQAHVRFYDKSLKRGGLTTYTALKDRMDADKEIYNGDFYIIDHLQNLSTGQQRDDDYARAMVGSQQLQTFVKSTGASAMCLAQQNEATVSSTSQKSYSPGVKGGGALSSAVDYLIEGLYKRDNMPDTQLKLTLKLGRSVGNGSETVEIHPPSGLILDNTWMKKLGDNS